MQPQDATTLYLFKLWPRLEANAKRIAFGAAFAVIAIFLISFYSYRQDKKEADAGQALTKTLINPGNGQTADAILKIAADYSGTIAGQRALLQGAAALFGAGRYADAQAQFQKFLDAYPDSQFSGQAALGVAASLDAQGKLDMAASSYQRVIGSVSDTMTVSVAKLAMARIYEAQGKLNDAVALYEAVARANPSGALGSEGAVRAMQLKARSPSAPPAATSAPFKLNR